ncbi:NUDIX domain-containing protein [Pseudahrensia aquimaris]|uniref:ADP-ribose pyrophosphatase n=1 Tax=Pseudahrensia aquimaris TaxID=744461 RepID=A0ABW3FJN7_9HYPH
MTIKDTHLAVTITDERLDHQGFRSLKTIFYREDISGIEAKRELAIAPCAVAVVAYDPDLEKLVMIRQFRLGAQMGTGCGKCVEVVAGLIDEGEAPEQAAIRELQEESGLTAKRVEKLCQFLTTPGLADEVIHLFYAEVDASKLVSEAGEASETEQTFPFTLSLDEALNAVDSNGIQNGIAMIALLWFARHKNRLVNAE